MHDTTVMHEHICMWTKIGTPKEFKFLTVKSNSKTGACRMSEAVIFFLEGTVYGNNKIVHAVPPATRQRLLQQC